VELLVADMLNMGGGADWRSRRQRRAAGARRVFDRSGHRWPGQWEPAAVEAHEKMEMGCVCGC
jgi:hypothetical protein